MNCTNYLRLVLALTAVLVGASLACAATAEPATANTTDLGRLFMTPQWRAQLERQRQRNIQESRTLEGGSMRLDGVVTRSSGKTTVWVNDRPQTENSRDAGVTATTSRQEPGRATLAPDTETPADLKVGQTINRATRETAGGLATGEIRVHRSTPQR